MRERMSIACNEDRFMKKKNKEKENKDKSKDGGSNDNVAYASSFAQDAQGKKSVLGLWWRSSGQCLSIQRQDPSG